MATTEVDPAQAEAFAGRAVQILNDGMLTLLLSVGHQTALLDLTVILIYVATAAAALLSGRLGHEPVLTAKGSPLNAVAAPPSPAAT